MTIYTLVGIIAASALGISILRFFIARPSNLLVGYLQDFVGAFFIFSGFIKGVDPMGTSIKMHDYLVALGLDFLSPTTMATAVIMIILELVIGFTLILGLARNWTLITYVGMVLFFTFLTGYTYLSGYDFGTWVFTETDMKVTDCGCFGDFLKLHPRESFFKDIGLMALLVILILQRRHIKPVLSRHLLIGIVTVVTLAFTWFNFRNFYFDIPIWDFRAYSVGANLPSLTTVPPEDQEQVELVFIYKNPDTGEQFEYATDELGSLPKGYEYVDRIDKVIKPGKEAKVKDFNWGAADGANMRDSILYYPGYSFIVITHQLKDANGKAFESTLNGLAEAAAKDGHKFFVLTNSIRSEIDGFKEAHGANYPFYNGDEKTVKTMCRANPGLMLLHNGVVLGKWHYKHIPDYETIKKNLLK